MKRCKLAWTLVLALLWLPATFHCQLERLPGLDFLACGPVQSSESNDAHDDGDCQSDGCITVESGAYSLDRGWGAPGLAVFVGSAAPPELAAPPQRPEPSWAAAFALMPPAPDSLGNYRSALPPPAGTASAVS